jgi:hypothetical protein
VLFYEEKFIKESTHHLRPEWELGTVKICETLDRSHTHIAFRKVQDNFDPVLMDVYHIVKLFPFIKKLKYLEKAKNQAYEGLMRNAIIADLATELFLISKYQWEQHVPDAVVNSRLKHLHILTEYKFINPHAIPDIIMHYRYLLSRMETSFDHLKSKSREVATFKKLCLTKLNKLEKDFLQEPHKIIYQKLKEKWQNNTSENVLQILMHPYKNGAIFDTDLDLCPRPMRELNEYQPKQSFFKPKKESVEHYRTICHFHRSP